MLTELIVGETYTDEDGDEVKVEGFQVGKHGDEVLYLWKDSQVTLNELKSVALENWMPKGYMGQLYVNNSTGFPVIDNGSPGRDWSKAYMDSKGRVFKI